MDLSYGPWHNAFFAALHVKTFLHCLLLLTQGCTAYVCP
jgi:hypothetical protein